MEVTRCVAICQRSAQCLTPLEKEKAFKLKIVHFSAECGGEITSAHVFDHEFVQLK